MYVCNVDCSTEIWREKSYWILNIQQYSHKITNIYLWKIGFLFQNSKTCIVNSKKTPRKRPRAI